MINKRKILNDPVHGFIRIPSELIYDLLEHPIFQRLRRIKQLGLSHYVYPGATHTRFQHTIGAMHLMHQAITHLRQIKIEISPEEEEAALIAILLHDIGHGPFSHALEHSIVKGIKHEYISGLLMTKLNRIFNNKLNLAIDIFNNRYHKKFLYQLVSSQLDMDRMDYLKRDSFYTGVVEGNIGTDRLIKMLTVVNDQLAIEAKGIYSIEKFLLARRLMYWQVYYHKAVIASELLLVNTLKRAKYLSRQGEKIWSTPALSYFLENEITEPELMASTDEIIDYFIELDDTDITVSAKQWCRQKDPVLKFLSNGIVNRRLPKVLIEKGNIGKDRVKELATLTMKNLSLNSSEVNYLVGTDFISNSAYTPKEDKINIAYNDGTLRDIAEVSDVLNISNLNAPSQKSVLYYPKH